MVYAKNALMKECIKGTEQGEDGQGKKMSQVVTRRVNIFNTNTCAWPPPTRTRSLIMGVPSFIWTHGEKIASVTAKTITLPNTSR